MEKRCEFCGKSFTPVAGRQRFCSKACGASATVRRQREAGKLRGMRAYVDVSGSPGKGKRCAGCQHQAYLCGCTCNDFYCPCRIHHQRVQRGEMTA
jgi:hypothetical protein